MIILSNEDGFWKIGEIEKCIAFMERVMKPNDWLLQEVPDDMVIKGDEDEH